MTTYNMTYVNQNQINYDGGVNGSISLSNNGTSYMLTPYGGSSEYGTVQHSMDGNDGIYTFQDATFTIREVEYLISGNGAFVRSLNNVLPNETGGTWTLEGGLPTMAPVVPIDSTGTTYNLTHNSPSDISIVDGSGRFEFNNSSQAYIFYPTEGGEQLSGTVTSTHYFHGVTIYTLSNHEGFVKHVGPYTAEDKGIWTYEGTLPLVALVSGITDMGTKFFEEDLETGLKHYFAEAFKFKDGDITFEKDADGNVTAKLDEAYADTLLQDLTNIVNNSITTSALTADDATINNTLTALGIDVTGLMKAKGVEVGTDGLTLEDDQGHKHRLGFSS